MLIQQDIYPSDENDEKQLEKKIILLYLIYKMDIPLSNSHISQFALEENYMNYYSVQQYLQEMVEIGYLDKSRNNNATHYTITDEGINALEAFIRSVPVDVKNRIVKYVSDNRQTVKKDFENTANYFFDRANNEYIVKCGVYEEDMTLMELHLSVVSKEQALSICNNWKLNVSGLYRQILNILIDDEQGKA